MKDELITSNKNKNNDKFNLNSDIDLYKISIKTLKDTKLSDFSGRLIRKLLTEMLDNSENIDISNIKYSNDNKPKNILIKSNYQNNKERLNQRYNNKNIYSYETDYKMNKSSSYYNRYKNNSNINNINGFNLFKTEKIIFQIKYDTKLGEDLAVIGSINELGNWKPYNALKMGWNEGNIWKTELYINDNTILDFEYKFILTCGGSVKRWEEGYNRKFNFSEIKKLIEICPWEGTNIHLNNYQGKSLDFNYNDNTLTMICWWNIK